MTNHDERIKVYIDVTYADGSIVTFGGCLDSAADVARLLRKVADVIEESGGDKKVLYGSKYRI